MQALRFSVSVPQYALLKALARLSLRPCYEGPLATIRLAGVPEPSLPSPEWVKIRTAFCGFCGSDLNLILLRESPTATPFTSFPCTMGHEVSGEITEVGSEVSDISVGDRVTVAPYLNCPTRGIAPPCGPCSTGRPGNCQNFAEGSLSPGLLLGLCSDVGGGFAPHFAAHRSQVFRLPQGLSLKEGALIEPLAAALQAVLDNRPDGDDRVLVIGAGVLGSLIIQSIRALGIGCLIAVAEPSPFHSELAVQAGANHLITDGDILGGTAGITGALAYKPTLGEDILMGGFSRIFDTVASSATLNSGMRALATGGSLSVVGIGSKARLDLTPLWLKLQTLRGAYVYGYNTLNGTTKHAFETAMDMTIQKKVRLEPMVTHVFPIGEYRRMIAVNLSKGRHRAVKTVVSFAQPAG
ncbi:MAG: zinc-binding dehydrogenase [Chloroflexi bacterium]|nr:zinc-binding dehydrogenase [Chloroflexota bacterium]